MKCSLTRVCHSSIHNMLMFTGYVSASIAESALERGKDSVPCTWCESNVLTRSENQVIDHIFLQPNQNMCVSDTQVFGSQRVVRYSRLNSLPLIVLRVPGQQLLVPLSDHLGVAAAVCNR